MNDDNEQSNDIGCGLSLVFFVLAYFGSFFIMKMDNVGLGILFSIAYCVALYELYRSYARR